MIIIMLGKKVFISKHGETIITILNVVMKIIINKKIIRVFKKDNQLYSYKNVGLKFRLILIELTKI